MANTVNVNWNNKHEGSIQVESFETKLSYKGDGLAPYEMFLGGYASCLHATFVGIAKKKRLEYNDISYNVYGEKRDEVPTLLKYVKTTITFTGVPEAKQKSFIKSMELAEKYCSISATINMIADMEFEYIFE